MTAGELQAQHVHFESGEYWTSVDTDREKFYEYLDNPEKYKNKNPNIKYLIYDDIMPKHKSTGGEPYDSHWKEIAVGNKPQEVGTGHEWESTKISEVDEDNIKRPPKLGLLAGGIGRHNVQVLKLTDPKDENPLETSTTGGKKSRKASRKSKKKSHKKRPTKKNIKKNKKKRTRKH
tara:strand:- start:391 stop:918 length:528 start_codon:yes stop_codon:yes gene_type:complete